MKFISWPSVLILPLVLFLFLFFCFIVDSKQLIKNGLMPSFLQPAIFSLFLFWLSVLCKSDPCGQLMFHCFMKSQRNELIP